MTTTLANRPVLVLNKSWQTVGVQSLERAITLLFKEHEDGPHAGEPKARIIDPAMDFQTFSWEDWTRIAPKDGEDVIRGVGDDFRIPEVILLTQYDRMPTQRLQFSRREIHKRDKYTCQYCGDKVGSEGTIDHVLPSSMGGQTTWENCVLACFQCNSQKANRTCEIPNKPHDDELLPIWTRLERSLHGVVLATRPDKKKNPEAFKAWKGPSPMKLLTIPRKPKFAMVKGLRAGDRPKSWSHFVSEAYWNVELENDNED
jgi:5-methylcytosine-specific restriction endonuclease McrA